MKSTFAANAKQAIRETLSSYAVAVDSADYAAAALTFCEDAIFSVQNRQPMIGRDAIVAGLRQGYISRKGGEEGNFQRHNLTTCNIQIETASEASATTYVIAITELGVDHSGAYQDTICKVADGWLIRARSAQINWIRPDSRFVLWPGKLR